MKKKTTIIIFLKKSFEKVKKKTSLEEKVEEN